jgi:hypothetical protein
MNPDLVPVVLPIPAGEGKEAIPFPFPSVARDGKECSPFPFHAQQGGVAPLPRRGCYARERMQPVGDGDGLLRW